MENSLWLRERSEALTWKSRSLGNQAAVPQQLVHDTISPGAQGSQCKKLSCWWQKADCKALPSGLDIWKWFPILPRAPCVIPGESFAEIPC